MELNKIYNEDCLDKLKELDENSVDSVVTDPPYELGFMGKKWDSTGIAYNTDLWKEVYRVLKPGGHLLSFGGSRTYHRMAVAIEDAGFEIRDQLMWVYGSGFPKSHNIGKAVDKKLGNEREVVGSNGTMPIQSGGKRNTEDSSKIDKFERTEQFITKGNSEWEGWGTALKPAHEPIVMARKPLSEKTIVDNVLEWGTGGINIDDSRIGTNEELGRNFTKGKSDIFGGGNGIPGSITEGNPQGRFPANVIFDKEAGKILDEQSGHLKSGFMKAGTPRLMSDNPNKNTYGEWKPDTVANDTYGDSGGASRFFYCPKTSKKDRNEGLDEFEEKSRSDANKMMGKSGNFKTGSGNDRTTQFKNNHPTVKPTDLMLYLIRLVTPKGGTTLDPFMGSGSSGKAAVRGGFEFVGIEREEEYMEIAEARIQYEIDNPYNEETGKRVTVNKQSQKFW